MSEPVAGLPAIMTTQDIAKLLKWPVRKTRRWLVKCGALEKVNGRWVTTLEKLEHTFSLAYSKAMQSELSSEYE